MKAAGLCGIVLVAAGTGLLAQTQQAPKAPVSAEAVASTAPVKPGPTAAELARWRQTIVHTQRPQGGCFTSEYPATAWTKVACGKPPPTPRLPARGPSAIRLVGYGYDYTTSVAPRDISWAEGSFDAVINVKSACSITCGDSACRTNLEKCTSGDRPNEYSLQLNTNKSPQAKLCQGHPKCLAEAQFVFVNRDCPNTDWLAWLFGTHSQGCAYIEYWLQNYDGKCPSGWSSSGGDCVANSQNAVMFKPFLVDDLGFMKLTGAVAGVHGKDDVITFTYANKAYSAAGDNRLSDLGEYWTAAEFNVFGVNNSAQAVFNSGSTLIVRIVTDSGTNSAPQCVAHSGITSETNNLTLTALPRSPASAPGPALIFAESNAPGTIRSPVDSCADVVTVGGTN
jgi:hypothetical protein